MSRQTCFNTLEDYVVANHSEIQASIEQARQEIKEEKFVDLNTFIREMEDKENEN